MNILNYPVIVTPVLNKIIRHKVFKRISMLNYCVHALYISSIWTPPIFFLWIMFGNNKSELLSANNDV